MIRMPSNTPKKAPYCFPICCEHGKRSVDNSALETSGYGGIANLLHNPRTEQPKTELIDPFCRKKKQAPGTALQAEQTDKLFSHRNCNSLNEL
jgi:hypothetical protein